MTSGVLGKKTKIIAEIGLVHEGSLGLAMSMAQSAISSGADIIKFQAHFPKHESSSKELFRTRFSKQDSSRWDYWERTSFSESQWAQLKQVVEDLGGVFSVSVFSRYALEYFQSVSTNLLKLGSGDLGNSELLELLSEFSGTLILSTGLATKAEIEMAAEWLKKSKTNNESAILQCTSMYPTPLNRVGINVMNWIQNDLGVNSGLSDHTSGIFSSLTAMTLGASYIEKHFVLSKEMFGPDVTSSILPSDLQVLAQFRDSVPEIMTPVDKNDLSVELAGMQELFGRSLGLRKDFEIGEIPTLKDFCLRKPAGGLDWQSRAQLVGKKLCRNYQIHELLTYEHFE